ncbi:hypothetical protein JIN77_01765 [Verrucomicrobiaceae bacterium R5-34]|nr:hypothetical protein [Verrucomicrobiaceae bacterium R5-34]
MIGASIYYMLLGSATLFFMGAIQLRKEQDSSARKLLVSGFALILLCAIYIFAQQLDIITINYTPYQDYLSLYAAPVPVFHKIVFWGHIALSTLGALLAVIGFVLEARQQIQSQRAAYNSEVS